MSMTITEISKLSPMTWAANDGADDFLKRLNLRIRQYESFGEYEFNFLASYETGDRLDRLPARIQRIEVSACPGSNEGYYVHLRIVESPSKSSLACAKTWDWESALTIAAVASRILGEGRAW